MLMKLRLHDKGYKPSFKPDVKNDTDTGNFDREFTTSYGDVKIISSEVQNIEIIHNEEKKEAGAMCPDDLQGRKRRRSTRLSRRHHAAAACDHIDDDMYVYDDKELYEAGILRY